MPTTHRHESRLKKQLQTGSTGQRLYRKYGRVDLILSHDLPAHYRPGQYQGLQCDSVILLRS